MTPRRVLLVLACSLAGLTTAVLGSAPTPAAEPTPKVAHIAFVGSGTPTTAPHGVAAFWERLRELGWVRDQNLVVEERWADGRMERLPALMADVVGLKVDVIVTYNTPSGIAAKKATASVPIVDAIMGDPLHAGLVDSLGRPGGNLTGLSAAWGEGIPGKWLELLQETVPQIASVAVILDPANPVHLSIVETLRTGAPARHLTLRLIEVREAKALDLAFRQAQRQAQAAVVLPSPTLLAYQRQVTALAAKHRLPAVYTMRDYVDAGGLMAYGPDFAAMFRRAADYVDKILRGAKPGDLPVEQPTKFELVVNLKAAKALGITIPESILLRADEVIR